MRRCTGRVNSLVRSTATPPPISATRACPSRCARVGSGGARGALAFWLASAVILLAFSVQAQSIDTERFKPHATHDGFINAEGSNVRGQDDPWEFGGYLHYGRNQLVVVNDNDITDRFVAGRLGLDLLASVTLAKPFALGLVLPVYAAQTGDDSPSFAGLGDARLVPKLRLLDEREGVGLALAAELGLPTHTGNFSGGTRMPTFAPKLIVDRRFRSGVRLGLNVGANLRERTEFHNVTAGHEFLYAGALGYRLGGLEGSTELGVELNGAVGLVERDREEVALETLPYVKYGPRDSDWEFTGGFGVGSLPGFGVPTWRVFVGIRSRPTAHDRDRDGVPDSEDACPDLAEDWDRVGDADGCPEEDDDEDGILDAEDRCPDEKETINGFEDDDGCADEGPAKVIVEEGRIRILEKIHFETNSDKIQEDSHSILNQVALTMKANRKTIRRVRVEGHTDDTGPRDFNMDLSQKRAHSVRRYLIQRGVPGERLVAKGFGPDRPIEGGTSEGSRAANRRVEFIVEQ